MSKCDIHKWSKLYNHMLEIRNYFCMYMELAKKISQNFPQVFSSL